MRQAIDLLIIKPGAQKKLYGGLSKDITGLEPPLWPALLAAFIRNRGFKTKIIDAEVEPEGIALAVIESKPKLIAVVVSGTNPSASTMNMIGARPVLGEIQKISQQIPAILIGLHPSALPEKTLRDEPVDMVCEGEGFFTLLSLLSGVALKEIKGLWYRKGDRIISNKRDELISLDDLPMPAWDLLPMHSYRAHNWHCFGHINKRSPYGVIYTSLGCPYSCSFCCINAIFGEHSIRYRDSRKVIAEIDYLVKNYNINNIKIIDEMFALKESHVVEFCDFIIERRYNLNIWAYARIDTLNERMLKKMKAAGINWLGIGFESASKKIRDKVSKGGFDNNRIKEAVSTIRTAGIYIGGNFIFGLPGETMETMQETLDLAKELNCEYTNFYVALPYPGSHFYNEALAEGLALPDSWAGFSQFGFDTQPLPTEYLTAAQILRFRDSAFNEFYSSKNYQNMILEKFGEETLRHVRDMLKIKLKRRLYESNPAYSHS